MQKGHNRHAGSYDLSFWTNMLSITPPALRATSPKGEALHRLSDGHLGENKIKVNRNYACNAPTSSLT